MAWLSRIWNTVRSHSLQRELEEEMRLHVELRAEALERGGLSREDARYAAARQFGNLTLETENTRNMDIARWLETLLKDVRYSLRQFVRTPVFTAVAAGPPALCIGAQTALFSVVKDALV